MADRSAQVLLAGLTRAAAAPHGLPLLASRTQPGLFPATAPGRQAAQHCHNEGLLTVVATENRRSASPALHALTDQGWQHLLSQVPPKQLLEDFLRVLEARQAQAADLLSAAQQMQSSLDGLRDGIDRLLRLHEPPPVVPEVRCGAEACLEGLARWRSTGDCPLPELYRLIATATPLSIGQFHDGLRQLHAAGRIYLHPWTGPLYELPEPQFALLIGHLVAYYASLRG